MFSLRFDALQIVAVETLIDLLQQFRGGVQIDLRGLNVHVPEVCGQPGESGVYVLPVAGPRTRGGKRQTCAAYAELGVSVIMPRAGLCRLGSDCVGLAVLFELASIADAA